MRAVPLAIALGLCLAAPTSEAAPAPREKFGRKASGWGLGLSLGDVSGASVKYFAHPHHAFQGQVGFGLLHNGDGIVSFEYLWHSGVIGQSEIVDVFGYVGLGIGLGFWASGGVSSLQMHGRDPKPGAAMMVRAPVLGLAFHWLSQPIDTALEVSWAPYVVMPDLLYIDAAIKVRYFF